MFTFKMPELVLPRILQPSLLSSDTKTELPGPEIKISLLESSYSDENLSKLKGM